MAIEGLAFFGEGLERPETVLATRSGDLFVPDRRGGISIVREDGSTRRALARNAPSGLIVDPTEGWLYVNETIARAVVLYGPIATGVAA